MLKKAAVVTLGCAKNSVDSEHIKGALKNGGLSLIENPQDADYIIVNTCGFIEAAKQESINTILELAELKNDHKQKKIIVTGCLAQRYFDELGKEIPEIDLLVGIADEHSIVDLLNEEDNRITKPSPYKDFNDYPERVLSGLPYAYLQVADGCDNRCSYCAIPSIRGRLRSKPMEKVYQEVNWLDKNSIKEVNIVAQDTGNYGYDIYGRKMMVDLISRFTGYENIEWIRLLYLQPYNLNDELIAAIKNNKFILPYIDVPFQHASQNILRAMNRGGAGSDYMAQITWLKRAIPEIVLRTSVIVGFPGETDSEFEELAGFIQKAEFDYLGIFEYSPEEGTKASSLDGRLPKKVIRERYHQLTALQDLINQKRNEERIGKIFDVLIEREIDSSEGLFEGRAWWQAPEVDGYTYVIGEVSPGQIAKVRIEEFDGCDFHGRSLLGSGQ